MLQTIKRSFVIKKIVFFVAALAALLTALLCMTFQKPAVTSKTPVAVAANLVGSGKEPGETGSSRVHVHEVAFSDIEKINDKEYYLYFFSPE